MKEVDAVKWPDGREVYTKTWWVTFASGKEGCLEGTADDVEQEAETFTETHGAPVRFRSLPYPANPRIGKQSDCPPLCYSPRECKGHTACPKPYACSE